MCCTRLVVKSVNHFSRPAVCCGRVVLLLFKPWQSLRAGAQDSVSSLQHTKASRHVPPHAGHAVLAGKLNSKMQWPVISRKMLQSDSEASEDSSEGDGSITAAWIKPSQNRHGPPHALHTLTTEDPQQQHQQDLQQQPWQAGSPQATHTPSTDKKQQPGQQASELQATHTLSTDKKKHHARILQAMHTVCAERTKKQPACRLQAGPVTRDWSAASYSSGGRALELDPRHAPAAVHIECSGVDGRLQQRHHRAATVINAGRRSATGVAVH